LISQQKLNTPECVEFAVPISIRQNVEFAVPISAPWRQSNTDTCGDVEAVANRCTCVKFGQFGISAILRQLSSQTASYKVEPRWTHV